MMDGTDSPWLDEDVEVAARCLLAQYDPECDPGLSWPDFIRDAEAVLAALAPRVAALTAERDEARAALDRVRGAVECSQLVGGSHVLNANVLRAIDTPQDAS
jgi:Cdc6-like AAA superfamily ATPase